MDRSLSPRPSPPPRHGRGGCALRARPAMRLLRRSSTIAASTEQGRPARRRIVPQLDASVGVGARRAAARSSTRGAARQWPQQQWSQAHSSAAAVAVRRAAGCATERIVSEANSSGTADVEIDITRSLGATLRDVKQQRHDGRPGKTGHVRGYSQRHGGHDLATGQGTLASLHGRLPT